MAEERLAKKQFVVIRASGIELEVHFLHPSYERPEIKPDVSVGRTAHLPLFRIDPVAAGLPAFVARIGHDDHQAVDIDLVPDKKEAAAFAKPEPGYVGHKTTNLQTDPRSYHINIQVPLVGQVFTGKLTIRGVGLGLRVFGSLSFAGALDAAVVRA